MSCLMLCYPLLSNNDLLYPTHAMTCQQATCLPFATHWRTAYKEQICDLCRTIFDLMILASPAREYLQTKSLTRLDKQTYIIYLFLGKITPQFRKLFWARSAVQIRTACADQYVLILFRIHILIHPWFYFISTINFSTVMFLPRQDTII